MLPFDPAAVQRNAGESTTEDLLDRITAYRSGMEPAAIPIIEAELERRGIGWAEIRRHEAENCADVILRPEGFAYRCSYCRRPAVVRRWGWHWLGGLVPVLPRILSYCARHAEMINAESALETEE
jgi:hypothetical protein